MNQEALKLQAHIQKQKGEKARLEQLKTQVDEFEKPESCACSSAST